VLNAIFFVLGWPFEWPTIVLVFLPILLTIVQAMKYDRAPAPGAPDGRLDQPTQDPSDRGGALLH
jgi:hypothetical protein